MIRSIAVAAALLAVPSTAAAASRPAVSTGGAVDITLTSATVTGTVNPEGLATNYHFQYGRTRSYGAVTGPTKAGNGTRNVAAAATVTGLAPGTTYHYRIVASNSAGTTFGGDHAFKTKAQPLGFTLFATPNPAPFAAATTLEGQLTGTGSTGRSVLLEQRAFPYTSGWARAGNPQVTDAAGRFAFPVLSLTQNTEFRVQTSDRKATSAIVVVGSRVLVHLRVRTHHVHSHSLLRFAGSVEPREDGALYAVQRRRHGTWVTVAGSSLRPYTAGKSRFARRVRIVHSGLYRVYVGVLGGSNVPGTSGEERLTIVHR